MFSSKSYVADIVRQALAKRTSWECEKCEEDVVAQLLHHKHLTQLTTRSAILFDVSIFPSFFFGIVMVQFINLYCLPCYLEVCVWNCFYFGMM